MYMYTECYCFDVIDFDNSETSNEAQLSTNMVQMYTDFKNGKNCPKMLKKPLRSLA